MRIERDKYLQELISKKENGKIKIITGIRRCGKSFLLSDIYTNYLKSIGIDDNQIIFLELDELANARYRNPFELDKYIREKAQQTNETLYVFIDEVQFVVEMDNPYVPDSKDKISFVDVLLGLMKIKNIDLYVTGSNSKMLSTDILTQFRDRGDEIHLLPLTFKEFYDAYEGDKNDTWREYYTYGGLPYVLQLSSHDEKANYLENLFNNTYLKDVIERNDVKNNLQVLEELLNIISSSIGSLTNPSKLENTFRSVDKISIDSDTINRYLNYFMEAFLIKKAYRYDVKGKKYMDTPTKYYFTDLGLRNARLGFRQLEETHIMENAIYNELIARGLSVDVGLVETRESENGKQVRKQYEVDFVARKGNRTFYLQSALSIDDPEKKAFEIRPFLNIQDSFKKIVIVKNHIMPYYDDNGIYYIGLQDFLLDENIFNY